MSYYFNANTIAENMQLLDGMLREMFLPEDLLSSDKAVASKAWHNVLSWGYKWSAIAQAWNLIHEYNVLVESGKMAGWSEEDKRYVLRGHALYAAEYLNHLTSHSADVMAVGAATTIVDALAKEGVNVLVAA